MTNYEKIRLLHEGLQLDLDQPITYSLLALRRNLIREETEEAIEELEYLLGSPEPNEEVEAKVRLLKELTDILVVVYGTAATFGLPIDEAYDLVHESNMSKLDNNGQPIKREDGKVLKGPNYKKADLSELV